MNKPIQAVDVVNIAPTSHGTPVNRGSGEEDGSSFAGILSSNQEAATGDTGGQSLQVDGNTLPTKHAVVTEGQQGKSDAATRVATPVLTVETGVPDNAEILLQLPLADGQSPISQMQEFVGPSATTDVLLNEGSVLADTGEAPESAEIAAPEEQQVALPVPVADNRLGSPTVEKTSQANPEQLSAAALSARAPRKVSALPASQPGTGSVRTEPAGERVTNTPAEAVHLAVTNQGADSELRQGLQGNRNPQADVRLAPAQPVITSVPYIQALTEAVAIIPTGRVPVPVGQPGWDQAVGQQVAWFVSRDISAANIRLNPQHLGPVEMLVSMDGDKANISFLSQHAVVRESLESSVPRLREMLAESGINLGDVNVSQHGSSHQQEQTASTGQQTGDITDAESGLSQQLRQPTAHGLVDYYA